MRFLEIFLGVGGLVFGMELVGFEYFVLVEWNKDVCNILKRNFLDVDVYCCDI